MSVIGISHGLRVGLASACELIFNAAMAEACREFETPVISFNWAQSEEGPLNCFQGNLSAEELEQRGADFPAVAWWTGSGADLNREKPRRFSGDVRARWRFFGFVKGLYKTGLIEQREAFEAALAGMLCRSDIVEGRYRKDLEWGDPVELQWLDQDATCVGWVQVVEFSATFEVNV